MIQESPVKKFMLKKFGSILSVFPRWIIYKILPKAITINELDEASSRQKSEIKTLKMEVLLKKGSWGLCHEQPVKVRMQYSEK